MDTVPEFENFLTFGDKPSVKINIQNIAQTLHPIAKNQHQMPIQRNFSAPSPVSHILRDRKDKIDYKTNKLDMTFNKSLKKQRENAKRCGNQSENL